MSDWQPIKTAPRDGTRIVTRAPNIQVIHWNGSRWNNANGYKLGSEPTCWKPLPQSFDPTKPVRTKSGMKARIICTDAKGLNRPLVALIEHEGGKSEFLLTLYATGQVDLTPQDCHYDLINITEEGE